MELYEIMLIIRPDIETEEQEEVISGLGSTIEKNGGTVDTILDWHKRRLSYEINKHKDGYYYLVYFSGPGTIIPELEHYFRVTDAVIRYMVVRADEKEYSAAADKAKAAVEAAAAADAVAVDETVTAEEVVEISEPADAAEADVPAAEVANEAVAEEAVAEEVETSSEAEETEEEKKEEDPVNE